MTNEEMAELADRYLIGLMQVEDHFSTICVMTAWIRLDDKSSLVFDGEVLKVAIETRQGDHLFFDPFDNDFDDESERHSFGITVESLAEMKERLEEDATVDLVELRMVCDELQQFLVLLREGNI